MNLKEAILEQTNGGIDVFEFYFPDIDLSKPFKLRDENTASTTIKCLEGVYYINDFGDAEFDGHAKNAIDFTMHQFDLPFVLAMHKIIKTLNLNIDISQYKHSKNENINVNLQPLTDRQIEYFNKRGISKEVLDLNNIQSCKYYFTDAQKELDAITFPYFEDEELINCKYRAYYKKEGETKRAFGLHKGAKKQWYNIDRITFTTKEIFFTEGEIDALTIDQFCIDTQQDLYCVLSVPNGVNSLNSIQEIGSKFTNVDTFWLFVDNDKAGKKLEHQLISFLGKSKCKIVPKKGGKDANEIYQNRGAEGILDCFESAQYLEIEGEVNVENHTSSLYSIFLHGVERGKELGYKYFDQQLTFKQGELTLVTGIAKHGKSSALNQFVERLNVLHNWKTAFWSPEFSMIERHFRLLMEIYTGKCFKRTKKDIPPQFLMSDGDFWIANEWLKENFYWIEPPQKTPQKIFELFEVQKRKHNINNIVIDPFNRIDFTGNSQSKLDRINNFLTELNYFKKDLNVHVFLVAHPRKMSKMSNGFYERPDIYDIAHSSDFPNQIDNAITVYRDMSIKPNPTEIIVTAIRDDDNGDTGKSIFMRDKYNSRLTQNEEMQIEPEEIEDIPPF